MFDLMLKQKQKSGIFMCWITAYNTSKTDDETKYGYN